MYFVISKKNEYFGKVYFTSNETSKNGMRLNRFRKDIEQACRYNTIGQAEAFANRHGINCYEIIRLGGEA